MFPGLGGERIRMYVDTPNPKLFGLYDHNTYNLSETKKTKT